MNIAMWGKALRTIPRISKDEWNALDIVSKFLIASRAGVLIITFISAGIAGLLALRDGGFNFGLWLLLTLGLLFAHATNNLLNDATDYVKGVDQDNYFRAQYGPQPLTHGLLTMRQLLAYAAVSGLLALAFGAYLIYLRGMPALLLLGLGAFFVLFYTWPLKYIGLGEIAVIVVWGPLMIGGGYYVITGNWDWNVVIAGLPYALGATSVIFGKHIDKFDIDKAKGIHTLPVILGEQPARYLGIGMMMAQYAVTVYLVVVGFFTPLLLVVVFALGMFRLTLDVYRNPKPAEPPKEYPAEAWPLWFVAFAFTHNRRFGLLFLLGLIGDVALRAALPAIVQHEGHGPYEHPALMAHLHGLERAHYVQSMFAGIARRYDLMNRLMTGAQDVRWRKRLVALAALPPGGRLLDLGTGTGDIAAEALRVQPSLLSVGGDFTLEIMRVGRRDPARGAVRFAGTDALNLPFPDNMFDAVTSGYLMRNVIDVNRAWQEQYRVLKPGGRVVCLDTTPPPRNVLYPFINFHLHVVIPILGRLVTGASEAYTYLPDSTENFLPAETLAERMRTAGFKNVQFKRLMFGTMALHWGEK